MDSNKLVFYPSNHYSKATIKGICSCCFWIILIFVILVWASIQFGINQIENDHKDKCLIVDKTFNSDTIILKINITFSDGDTSVLYYKKSDISNKELQKLNEKYLVNHTYTCFYRNAKLYWKDYNDNKSSNIFLIIMISILTPLCLISCIILLLLMFVDRKSDLVDQESSSENNTDRFQKKDGEKYEGFEDEI